MTTVSVRDLRYDFRKVESLLRQGEEIQVTKRGKVIARISSDSSVRPPLPEIVGRVREIYGDRVFEVSGADSISAERDRIAEQDAAMVESFPDGEMPPAAAQTAYARKLPDFMARLKRIYGDKVQEITGAEIVRMDRDRY